jgi:hypothetical protein
MLVNAIKELLGKWLGKRKEETYDEELDQENLGNIAIFSIVISDEGECVSSVHFSGEGPDIKTSVNFLTDISRTVTGVKIVDSLIEFGKLSPEYIGLIKLILTEAVEQGKIYDRPAILPREVFENVE